MIVGDFNSDGNVALAMADSGSDTVSILLGRGDGTFQGPIDFIARGGPSSLAAGDFNGDGALDLAVTIVGGDVSHGAAGVSVLLNDPGIALFPTTLSFGKQPVGKTTAPKTVLLSNPSAASLEIGSITIAGANVR